MNYTFCDVHQQQEHGKLKGPHATQAVGWLQACKPAAEEWKEAAKSWKCLSLRPDVQRQPRFAWLRAASTGWHHSGYEQESQSDQRPEGTDNHRSSGTPQLDTAERVLLGSVPGEHIYKSRYNTLVCIKSRNKFPLIAHCMTKESNDSFQ